MTTPSVSDLVAAADAVLKMNEVGAYTKPSPRLYPHQWNWDSAFIAIGLAHLDWPRAVREIDALLAGQWIDGMLPHIRYNPNVTDYAPGPEWWPDVPVRRRGEITSGITQPPVLATAVYTAGLLQPDAAARRRWWQRVFQPLTESVAFFQRHRATGDSPLIVVVHPWESGADNSPRWDFAVRANHRPSRPYRRIDNTIVGATERPHREDYDLYMYLVEQIVARGYEVRMPGMPFAVYDALFNAIWYRAAVDLNRIARALETRPPINDASLRAFRAAYHATLWQEATGAFHDYDLLTGSQIPVVTCAALAAIYAGLVDADQARMMLTRYQARCPDCRMVPSTAADQPGFDPVRYWRGPIWVNINWMVTRGLEDLGLHREASALADGTLALVRSAGFREYFHPRSGAGLGGSDFSWSAALTVDLLRRPVATP